MGAGAGGAMSACMAETVESGDAVRWHEECHCGGAVCAPWPEVASRALRPVNGWSLELGDPGTAIRAGRRLRGYRSARALVAQYTGDPVTLRLFPGEAPRRYLAVTLYVAEGSARVVTEDSTADSTADLRTGDLVVVPPDGVCAIHVGEATSVTLIGMPHPEPHLVRPGLHRMVPLAGAGHALADALMTPPTLPLDAVAAGWAEGALRELVLGVMALDAAPIDHRAAARARARAYIDVHFEDPALDVSGVARGLGMSVRTLHEAFAGSRETVSGVIRRRRVEAAKVYLIARPNRNLAGIARRSGFGGPDQFRRVFRAEVGMLPGEYRAGASKPAERRPTARTRGTDPRPPSPGA
ncbi:AraC family transcriptional regulator [Occultella glacieicola]|uniref:AraC family transcriptional regulator n=1 Tax=Occultella glacieicola TaxID=2518684 RepID=A0ABY2E966_9MICO|nr:helix-turn-helix domain-containing protein [Occultella glacieicola]TDE98813.1 AraC family transcriptional regulator [Occultella glacieicola]